MNLPVFPVWLSWLLLLAVIWLAIQVSMLQARVATNRPGFRNRQDLEDAYTRGTVSRDEYEKLKGRLQ